jgi:hypothetical protein
MAGEFPRPRADTDSRNPLPLKRSRGGAKRLVKQEVYGWP